MCAYMRLGVAWVRMDGSICPHGLTFLSLTDTHIRSLHKTIRGFLLLFPTRKNRLSTPSWIPVAEQHAISMLAAHITWLRKIGSQSPAMFLARKVGRSSGTRCYHPNTSASSRISTDTFRLLFRLALTECCSLSKAQAYKFGTHSFRLAAMELMRQRGVPAELRQQMGDWMSEAAGHPCSIQHN